jgi:hypothetical protein
MRSFIAFPTASRTAAILSRSASTPLPTLIFADLKPILSQFFASAAASSGGSSPIQPLNSTSVCVAPPRYV